jgi:hypothetical protein
MNTVDIRSFLSGTITDYVEGMAPMHHGPGDWYYMPPDTPMSAANEGDRRR